MMMLILCLSACLVYFIRKYAIKTGALKKENEQMQAEEAGLENFYESIKKEIEMIKKYRHDIKKHIYLLEEILHYEELARKRNSYDREILQKKDNERKDGAEKEIPERTKQETAEHVENTYINTENKICCDNIFVTAICLLKKKQCAEKHIPFLYDVFLPCPLSIEGMEISSLMQNLLDNAIEANEQMKDAKERKIVMKVRQGDWGWSLYLFNACPEIKEIDFHTWKEDKNNHGYGVRIIQEIVEKYQGKIEYTAGKDRRHMIVKIFFPEEIHKAERKEKQPSFRM